MKRLFPLLVVGSLFAQAPAHAGKLGSLLGNEGFLKAGSQAVTGMTLSDADVIRLSAESVAEMDKANPIAPANNPYDKRLAGLVRGMEHEDGLDLNFKVYLVKDVNAFAMADGSVRLFAGLMDKMSDDELMSVIGHEIGHVKKGHSKHGFKTALLASAARNGVASAGGTAGAMAASQLGAIGEAAINAKFSRNDETQADEYGVDFMLRHKRDPKAAVEAMKKLGGSAKASLFDSHPASPQRAENLQRYIDRKR